MEDVTMQSLLREDEELLLNSLQADREIEKSREKSVERLGDELGNVLLRYNAACAADRTRQAVADCMAATARETLGLLLAADAEKEAAPRRVEAGAPYGLICAAVFCVVAALLFKTLAVAAYACMAAAVVCAYISGRSWYREREVTARAVIDPQAVWHTLERTAETMDRKMEEFAAQERERRPGASGKSGGLGQEELKLYGDLLEALYSGNGAFALKQLTKLRPYLQRQGIELRDYDGDNGELFELFPTKNAAATQRPALLSEGEKLLLIGRATEPGG